MEKEPLIREDNRTVAIPPKNIFHVLMRNEINPQMLVLPCTRTPTTIPLLACSNPFAQFVFYLVIICNKIGKNNF
jgi:hypothetical protein